LYLLGKLNPTRRIIVNNWITQLDTVIGPLKLTASEAGLVLVEFKSCRSTTEKNHILTLAVKELSQYFAGRLKKFTVPLDIAGTDFQKKAWKELKKIPYGKTISYKEQAVKMGGANYARAVAGANNKNKLPIIIPCHRVIGSDGSLVGYAGGLKIKKVLIDLEIKKV
jgi:methylated-DNA-[protein]-cysteine S-methyltransferase